MTSTVDSQGTSEQTVLLPLPPHAALPRHAAVPPRAATPGHRGYPSTAAPTSMHPRPLPVPPAGLGAVPHVGLGPAPSVPAAPATSPAGMRWGWLAMGAALAVLAVAALVSFAGAHRTMTVHGTVTISGMNGLAYPGTGCSSTTWQGTPVSIYDASGALVGTSSLPGEGIARDTWSTYYAGYADSCEYAFTATGVSGSSDYYRIAVGSGQSQGVSFSRAQLESGAVGITLH